jgi:hypothetical protein
MIIKPTYPEHDTSKSSRYISQQAAHTLQTQVQTTHSRHDRGYKQQTRSTPKTMIVKPIYPEQDTQKQQIYRRQLARTRQTQAQTNHLQDQIIYL